MSCEPHGRFPKVWNHRDANSTKTQSVNCFGSEAVKKALMFFPFFEVAEA